MLRDLQLEEYQNRHSCDESYRSIRGDHPSNIFGATHLNRFADWLGCSVDFYLGDPPVGGYAEAEDRSSISYDCRMEG